MTFYPLTFEPILKDRIWGGTKLHSELGKPIPTPTTGESWELSGVPGDVSIIANGRLKGKSIDDVIKAFPQEVLGRSVANRFGDHLPLLFKFIDAREDLSIQVHPNDELARARHNSFGKTEMWYIMHADPGARLIVGFRDKCTPEDYLSHLNNNTLPSILKEEPVAAGDVFFLETGTVHAIGAGVLLAEIQQTSDITYRIYDWDRTDAQGNPRQLHTEEALEAMHYDAASARTEYSKAPNNHNTVVDCPYFLTSFIPLEGTLNVSADGESFVVYMCVEGSASIGFDSETVEISRGQTVFMPAAIREFSLSGSAKLLEVKIS